MSAAYQLTSSATQRDKTGTPQQYTPLRRTAAIATAALYATNPAVDIWVHPAGASARLTNLRTARLTIAVVAVLLVIAVTVALTSDHPTIYLPTSLAVPILSAIAATSIDPLRAANATHDNTGTHLLTDLTRHPAGQPGSATLLIAALPITDRRIIGTAANASVWEKVYAETATPTGPGLNGSVHFALRPKET